MTRKRRDNRKRDSRRRQPRGRRNPAAQPHSRRSGEPDGPHVVRLFELEITDGPVSGGQSFDLTEGEVDEIEALAGMARSRPRTAVAPLRRWIERHPEIDKLWNLLYVALASSGQREEAERVLGETYERFPNYLFAIAALATRHVYADEIERAEKVLEGRMFIGMAAPGRRVFHTSEFVAYEGAVALLRLARGEEEEAMLTLDAIKKIAPNDPMVKAIEKFATRTALRSVMEALQSMRRPRKRKPSRALAIIRAAVDPQGRALFDLLVAETDRLAREHLTDEYRDDARELAAELCVPGTPAARGRPLSWASGILYVLGRDNFLSDSASQPHMSLEELARRCGVSPATAAAKARAIREVTGRPAPRNYRGYFPAD